MTRKKIKVLHLLKSKQFSGAENVACEIIKMFEDDNNFEMAYCSPTGKIKNTLEKKNIIYFPMKSFSLKEIKRVVSLYNPDIIHAHDFSASVLSSFLPRRFLVLSHLHNNPPWIKRMGLYSSIYLFSSLRFKKILTVSNSVMQEYVFGDLLAKKTIMVQNPIDVNAIKNLANGDYSLKNYDIAFIGRLTTQKNPMRFISLISNLKKKLPNISVVMIGDGPLSEQCYRLVKDLGLNNNITFTGFLANPLCVLANVKVLCMTSEWEGFGLVAVEALALGRPVVCTPVGGLPMLVNNKCGEICWSDEEFIDELTKLLIDREYWKKKSYGSSKQANLLDNVESYKRKIHKTYFKVLGENLNNVE